MSFIGATGFNSFKQELDTEIQNTSNYINSVVLAEGIVDSNLTTRITDLEQNVGETADISNNILATGFHLAIDDLENNVGTPKTSTSINEPTITTGTYVSLHQVDTEHKYILYKHDGSTNTSTSYSITFNENTICDIFVLGGGGAGSGNGGGGGGAGGLSFLENATITAGTYNIVVGNGGSGGSGNGSNGNNSSFLTNEATPLGIVAYGGGGGTSTTGGSTTSGTYTGTFTKSSINHFSNNGVSGGGGGGANANGNGYDGGDGIKNISSIDFKTHFNITNNSTIGEEDNSYLYFAGGGGKNSGDNGKGNVNSLNTITGGGGKGGASGQNGNDGSEGLVIIRYKFSTISVLATGLNLQIHNLKNEIGEAPTLTPLYIGTGMHREITLLEQGVGLPTSIQSAWMSHGNGLYGITDSIMTQLGMTDYAVGANAAELFATQLTGTFATLLGWIAGTGATITVAQAINKLDERIKPYEDNIKDNLQQGDVVVILVNDRTDDMYFLNAGNVGIGFNKNTQLSAKLHVNGNFHCNDVNCDDIVCDKIGLGTSTNHTNTLLDVRGNCSFGDSSTLVQAIALKSQSGEWHITSDNGGNNGNNQFVISSLRTINGFPNTKTEFLLIDNITGYVGVGKTPAYKLDVDGNINCTGLRVNGSVFTAWTNVITGYLGDIKWNSGSVGINIGSSSIPIGIKLDVRGNIRVGDGATASQSISLNSSLGSYSIGSDNSGGGLDNSGNFNGNQFYIYDNNYTSYIMTAQRSTGNIGIGNANRYSSYKLDVDGDVNIKSGSKYKINGVDLQYADLNNLLFTGLDANTLSVNGGILSVIGGGGSSQWTTNGTSIYPSSSSTNVVIGSTQTSSYKLDVNGNVNISSGSKYKINGNDLSYSDLAGTAPSLFTTAGSTDIFWNVSGARLGIGISPSYELDVSGNAHINGNQYITGQVGIGVLSPATNAKLDIKDSYSVTGNGNGDGMITIRGAIGAGRGGTSTHGKQGLYVAHVNGTQGVSIGFAGVAQTGSSNVPLLLYGKGTDVIKFVNGNGADIFIFRSNGDVAFDGSIVSMPSDLRIKENIREIDDKEALNKILALQPKKYEYIDKISRGDKTVIGFIAQQVREIIPEAIQIDKKIIANVLQWCNYDAGKIFINIDDIKIGTKINIRYNDKINDGDNGDTFKIKAIHDDYVELDDEDGMIKIPDNMDRVYVFGYEINDFHYLDKNAIYTHNVSATQELYKIIMEQENRISKLEEILVRNGIV